MKQRGQWPQGPGSRDSILHRQHSHRLQGLELLRPALYPSQRRLQCCNYQYKAQVSSPQLTERIVRSVVVFLQRLGVGLDCLFFINIVHRVHQVASFSLHLKMCCFPHEGTLNLYQRLLLPAITDFKAGRNGTLTQQVWRVLYRCSE